MTNDTVEELWLSGQESSFEVVQAGQDLGLETVFDVLENRDRRRLLEVLDARGSGHLTMRDLATYLVPEYHQHPREPETNEEVQRAIVELQNSHLPPLDSAGIIDWVRSREVVTRGSHFEAFQPFLALIDHSTEVPPDTRTTSSDERGTGTALDLSPDDLIDVLGNRRRRYVCYYLATTADECATFDAIVDRVVSMETAAIGCDSEPSVDYREQVARDLRHDHLTKLARTGIVAYDSRAETVRYRSHRQVEMWLDRTCQFETG